MKITIYTVAIFFLLACKEKVATSHSSPKDNVPVVDANVMPPAKTASEPKWEEAKAEDKAVTTEPQSESPVVKEVQPVEKKTPREKEATTKEEVPTKKTAEKPVVTETKPTVPTSQDSKPDVPQKVEKVIEQVPNTKPAKKPVLEKVAGMPIHKNWSALLAKYVSPDGKVDYKGMKSELSTLEAYLSDLSLMPPQPSWSREAKLAYWINTYNAFTVKLILDNYPLKSITDLHGGKPWDVKWIKLGDKTYSLNNIENDIIRPQFKEPRIHFAVNCAAVSCPPLANEAFTMKNLESLLEKQTKAFVNSSANQLSTNEIKVSKIFDWYGEDFGNVANFIARYADTRVSPKAKVSFLEYDWALNGK